MVAACEAAGERNNALLERLHSARYACEVWESWTEQGVALMEGDLAL